MACVSFGLGSLFCPMGLSVFRPATNCFDICSFVLSEFCLSSGDYLALSYVWKSESVRLQFCVPHGRGIVCTTGVAVQVRVVGHVWGIGCNHSLEDDMRSLGTEFGDGGSHELSCRWLLLRGKYGSLSTE